MFGSPIPQSCPPYAPASQVTPDSVDELPTQEPEIFTQAENSNRTLFDNESHDDLDSDVDLDRTQLFTQESETNLVFEDVSVNTETSQQTRNYYEQLFSSDSDDSDISTQNQSTLAHQANLENLNKLSVEDKNALLGFNQPIPKMMMQETSPENHTDKIATYNVQNKYDHVSAAELMFKENITFIAFQEPFHSSNAPVDSWQSFSKCELQSSRLDCYQTHHQIILVDTFRWGGKTLTAFESYINGRITGISFQFGDGKKLGIISIYASSAEIHNNDVQGANKEIFSKFKHIKERWEKKYADMDIIILGDFQETCTISDRDNVGNFRKSKLEEGILMQLEDSYESYVRKLQTKHPYVTRFGGAGARGIDHIMLPIDEITQTLFPKAYICRDQGATYFPSDHSLLICEYDRNDRNNNEDGMDTIKYKYSNLYSIKMKNTGPAGKNISINDSQFKDSIKFKEQAALYCKAQQVTGDTANLSNYHLDSLEARLDSLTESLWQAGKDQQACGPKNKLVRIDEQQAIEIAFIYKKFMLGVQDVMGTLKLTEERNSLASAGTTRGRVRQGKGFKMFHNLPIPSKLRYLRNALKAKRRLIEKAQNWLKELYLRQIFNSDVMKEEEFWNIRDCIVKTSTIERHTKNIAAKMYAEDAERETHMNHINFMKSSSKSKGKQSKPTTSEECNTNKANCLPFISASMTSLINKWLEEAGCTHAFNMPTSSSTWLESLTKEITNWKMPLTDFWEEESIIDNVDFRHRLQESLETCAMELKKIENKVSFIQAKYKRNTLIYFLKVNMIDSFTKKVLHKERSAPTTHSIIWDEALQTSRPCINEIEELKATQEFHGKWMGNTKAPENCAFAEIIHEGKLGPRGIKLKSDRKLQMKDIPRLIHNGQKLSRKVKRAFIAAHNKYISKLFRYPNKNRKEFFYPFYLQNKEGKMNDESLVERKLWKSLGSVPGKARHDGFQLATIGRFGRRWRRFLCKMIKTMLVMRYIPYTMKKIARYPIPKPGKINEYRPISLCNDLYCFLNSIITAKTSRAIEKAKLLHSGIASYRRGKSCATLVTVEQSFREDCIEGNLPAVQLDEDEEKFFDRVCLEIILASMRINGFPDSGFIEFKACMMSEKIVEIITCKGTVFAKFVCGLEQGNPDSPTIANLVIKMKHDVWAMLPQSLRDIIRNDPTGNCSRYKFHVQDKDDGEVWIYMMGYCDDNTKFLSAQNEELLIPLVQHYIQMAGDLSMITKIGRKSSKCEIQFFNISAKMTVKLQKMWSTAWSFVHDAPIEEQVPFKVYLQDDELIKFYNLTKYDSMSVEEKEKWDYIVHPKAHRHLGLTATLGGDTSKSSQATISKMHDRLTKLKVRHMEHDTQVKCINMLIATMHSYVPLQNGFDQEELNRLDASIVSAIQTRNGISSSDCKHRVFIPTHLGGLGFISTLDIDIIATARELEILSNGQGLDSESFRTRIAAIPGYIHKDEEKILNHARRAIHKLARYGFYFRDKRDGIINDILEEIAEDGNLHTIGSPLYRDGNAYSIGYGKPKNLKCAFGSPLHIFLRRLKKNRWISDGSENLPQTKIPCSVEKIIQIKKSVQERNFQELTSFHSFFEWNNFRQNKFYMNVEKDKNSWKEVNIQKVLRHRFPSMEHTDWDSYDILREEIEQINKIQWQNHIIRYSKIDRVIEFDTYSTVGKMFQFIEKRGSPIIIGTDGAHAKKTSQQQTSSSFVICSLDIRIHETLKSGEWINRPMIPLMARSTMLPQYIGAHDADIAHGEGYAFALQELAFDSDIPRIIITDSVAIREQVMNVRDEEMKEIDRDYVRNKAGGISKYLIGIIKNHMDEMSQGRTQRMPTGSAQETWIHTLRRRNIDFLQMAKEWTAGTKENLADCESVAEEDRSWNPSYNDEHEIRAIIKVDSHQLEKNGRTIKRSPRYSSLIPNLALLSANHHADVGAELGLALSGNQKAHTSSPIKAIFHKPISPLTFYIAADGHLIDRHISKFICNRFNDERIKRLKTKATQGFLWRIFNHVTITWKILQLHKGFFRSLLGLSNSHSRNIYKSTSYREGNLHKYLETVKDEETKQCIKAATVTEQIQYLLPCPWCCHNTQVSEKGNRRHILLHCNNEKISKYRNRMNNVVGSRLNTFFEELGKKMLDSEKLNPIYDIARCFIKLQDEQTGRLKKLSRNRNITYLSINDIIRKMQVHSIEEALTLHPIQFFINLFHLAPEHMFVEPSDDELGVLDSVWMGLMPIPIAQVIHRYVKRISITFIDKEEGMVWKENLIQDWKQIENFNMGRAIGIHRIMNGVGNEFEAELTAKFNIQDTQRKFERKRKAKAKKLSVCLHQEKSISQNKKSKKDHNNTPAHQTICNGLTCGLEKVRWCGTSVFSPNSIPIQRKQCLRCSLFITAMKATANILIHLQQISSQKQMQMIKGLQEQKQKKSIAFNPLIHMLKTYIPSNVLQFKRAQYISKNRPTEKWKRICKLLVELATRKDNPPLHPESITQTIQNWINEIEQTIHVKDTELKHNKVFMEKCLKDFQNEFNPTEVPSPQATNQIKVESQKADNTDKQQSNSNSNNVSMESKLTSSVNSNKEPPSAEIAIINISSDDEENDTNGTIDNQNDPKGIETTKRTENEPSNIEKEAILKGKINLMNRRMYTAGSTILMAIEVIRDKYKDKSIYIACPEAAQIITSWNPNEGWSRFARIFYSAQVCHRKPNGLYIIPVFSGETTSGHWSVIAIQKHRRRRVAVILDSLGKGSLNAPIIRLISQAFQPTRGRVLWKTPECRKQTGVECGARTICAMSSLAEAFHDGKEFEENIRKATLWSPTEYDQMDIRRAAAAQVQGYRNHMITRAIRLRQWR